MNSILSFFKNTFTSNNRVSQILNSRFYVWLRGTIVYNTIAMFLIVIILLHFIFLLAPHTAYISYEATTSNGFDVISANIASMTFDTSTIVLSQFKNAVITIDGAKEFIVNGDKQYDSSYRMVVQNLEEHSGLYIHSKNSDTIPIALRATNHRFFSPAAAIQYDSAMLTTSFYDNVLFDINDSIWINSENANIFLSKQGYDAIPVDTCTIIADSEHSISINASGASAMVCMVNEDDNQSNEISISLERINEFRNSSTGTLSFAYKPSPDKYDINNQDLLLKSSDYALQGNVRIIDGIIISLVINGTASSTYLSGIDLFPSFRGWYSENVYLAPLTLVATVFGGVELLKKKNAT